MFLFNNYLLYVIIYIISSSIFNLTYKTLTTNMLNKGALTILLQTGASFFSLICIFFTPLKFPTSPLIYIFLFFSCIFYALNSRLATTSRSGLQASTYTILKQLSTVFVLIAGFTLFKEPLIFKKIIGSFLIIISNILVFYHPSKVSFNKYLITGLFANLSLSIALLLDVKTSPYFNIGFYVTTILLLPSLLISICEKINFPDIQKEYHIHNKKILYLTMFTWSIMMITKMRAYQLGSITLIATLCSLSVIFTVFISYIFLKERDNLIKKLLASLFIVIGISLIK